MAAMRNAGCRPSLSATNPQSSAPTVIEPVKVSIKTARARARTQTGKNSCSSAASVEVMAIHATPARTRVTRAARKLKVSTITAKAAA